MAELMQFRFKDPRDYLPRYTVARGYESAPQFFSNLLDIRQADQARTSRVRALTAFAEEQRRQQELAAQQAAFSRYASSYPTGQPFNGGRGSSVGGGAMQYRATNYSELGRQIAARHGITGSQWNALYTIGMRESGWRNTAQNPTSSAYGIGQFLDSTWGTVGGSKTSNPALQIEYMIRYINNRYGSPGNALAFWNRNHWY